MRGCMDVLMMGTPVSTCALSTLHPACTLHAHFLHPACTLHATSCILHAPCMYPACTLPASCTLHVPCMQFRARYMHLTCTLHAPCHASACHFTIRLDSWPLPPQANFGLELRASLAFETCMPARRRGPASPTLLGPPRGADHLCLRMPEKPGASGHV
eukprot:364215-Chlamydomonas_euryale.AAC.19